MLAHRVRCILALADGPARRVRPQGLTIGRHADCDIVAPSASVSRRHALVRLTTIGAELVPIGRGPVVLNGRAETRPRALADGDRVEIGDLVFAVELVAEPPAVGASTFQLARERGGSFGISHAPFLVGGDERDDLIIKRWPAHALVFHLAEDTLYLEVTTGAATHNGARVAREGVVMLVEGDRIAYRKETFVVHRCAPQIATTVVGAPAPIERVTVEMLPRGGRVVLGSAHGELAVFLHDRRLDLVLALLKPPAGYQVGDLIPDELIAARVWPRRTTSREDLNVLISRCRKDLVAAGLSATRILERAPGGGATRIVLAPGARVEIQ